MASNWDGSQIDFLIQHMMEKLGVPLSIRGFGCLIVGDGVFGKKNTAERAGAIDRGGRLILLDEGA